MVDPDGHPLLYFYIVISHHSIDSCRWDVMVTMTARTVSAKWLSGRVGMIIVISPFAFYVDSNILEDIRIRSTSSLLSFLEILLYWRCEMKKFLMVGVS
jgi:hypothetical protein